jgi:hypothetical protein
MRDSVHSSASTCKVPRIALSICKASILKYGNDDAEKRHRYRNVEAWPTSTARRSYSYAGCSTFGNGSTNKRCPKATDDEKIVCAFSRVSYQSSPVADCRSNRGS